MTELRRPPPCATTAAAVSSHADSIPRRRPIFLRLEATLKGMLLSEFDYALPPELIAQQPLEDRWTSRMLVVDRARGTHGAWEDRRFTDFPSYLRPGDCLV